eukprot:gb/GECH01007073.1/.p1 GENE.gb/GECH01007073.1/~~gb/GECH01007073.1/.p1  ORF type:complete len:435 (+),score=106.16 gb/GECH01007073.1/:1-1305(+)
MRHLQLPAPLSFSFDSPVLPNAVALGDVNGDGNMGLVAASVGGAVALFQGRSAEPVWRTTLPGTVSAVTMGRVAGWEWTQQQQEVIFAVTAEGLLSVLATRHPIPSPPHQIASGRVAGNITCLQVLSDGRVAAGSNDRHLYLYTLTPNPSHRDHHHHHEYQFHQQASFFLHSQILGITTHTFPGDAAPSVVVGLANGSSIALLPDGNLGHVGQGSRAGTWVISGRCAASEKSDNERRVLWRISMDGRVCASNHTPTPMEPENREEGQEEEEEETERCLESQDNRYDNSYNAHVHYHLRRQILGATGIYDGQVVCACTWEGTVYAMHAGSSPAAVCLMGTPNDNHRVAAFHAGPYTLDPNTPPQSCIFLFLFDGTIHVFPHLPDLHTLVQAPRFHHSLERRYGTGASETVQHVLQEGTLTLSAATGLLLYGGIEE